MCTNDLNLMSVCLMRRYRCLQEGTAVTPCHHQLGPPPPQDVPQVPT